MEITVGHKIGAIRNRVANFRSGPRSGRRNWQGYTMIQLTRDVLCDLSTAWRKGKLPTEHQNRFLMTPRAELMCEILMEAKEAFEKNIDQFGADRRWCFWGETEAQALLRKNVFRLTRDEILEKYGVEHYRYGNEVYVDDVVYARFLRDNDLGHRKEAAITEDDLPPITGNDVFARRDIMMRAAFL